MPPTHPSRNWTGCGSTHTKSIIEFWWHLFGNCLSYTCFLHTEQQSPSHFQLAQRRIYSRCQWSDNRGSHTAQDKKDRHYSSVAASLHIFHHITTQLLQQTQPMMPSEEIEKSTLLHAIEYVRWAESQKEISKGNLRWGELVSIILFPTFLLYL